MFVITISGQRYTFMSTKEFAAFTGESTDSLYKKTHDPARIKWNGKVFWIPELLALNLLPQETIGSQYKPFKLSDFEPYLKSVGER